MKTNRTEYFRRYREEHREALNAYHKQWTKDNPEKVREYKKRYKAKKRGSRERLQEPNKS